MKKTSTADRIIQTTSRSEAVADSAILASSSATRRSMSPSDEKELGIAASFCSLLLPRPSLSGENSALPQLTRGAAKLPRKRHRPHELNVREFAFSSWWAAPLLGYFTHTTSRPPYLALSTETWLLSGASCRAPQWAVSLLPPLPETPTATGWTWSRQGP